MATDNQNWYYTLVYQVGGGEHVETFDNEDEMKRFIAETNVRPLFHYMEKEPK